MSQQQRPRAQQPVPVDNDLDLTDHVVELLEKEDDIIEITRPTETSEPEAKKCWICFEEETEQQIIADRNVNHWIKPCKCSLIAHEECLWTWIDESQKGTSQGIDATKPIRCPQCKELYVVKSQHSFSVRIMSRADSWITKALFATVPLGVIKAVGVSCFFYGQGVLLDVLGEDRVTDLVLSLRPGDQVRYIIGACSIPFALIGSRFDACNFVLPLLPSLVCFSDTSFVQSKTPMESSPALWVCVLPWLRTFYCYSWQRLLGPLEAQWKADAGLITENVREIIPGINVRPAEGQDGEDERINEENRQRHLQELQDIHDRLGQDMNRMRDQLRQEIDRLDAIAQEHGLPQPPRPDEQEDDAVAERWIFVEAPQLARLIAGALLLPKIASMAGSMLDRIPFLRKRFPHKFQKVILGGVSFIVLKDLVNLAFLYNRAKSKTSRRIISKAALR